MSLVNVFNESSVRIIELNRPEKRNALNDELVSALKGELGAAGADGSVRAVLIRGAGKDFCAGADLSAIQKIAAASYEENLEDARSLGELFTLIRSIRIPVIAAVRGRALAGGCGLAMACDLILSEETARFGFPEVKIGFVPAMVAAIVRRSMPEKEAFAMLTLGRERSAGDLATVGVVHAVFSIEAFDAESIAFAGAYAKLSSSAVRMTKELLYEIDGMPIGAAIDRGAEVNADARMTEDCRNGIARFLQK